MNKMIDRFLNSKLFTIRFYITYVIMSLIVLFTWIGLEYTFDGQVISQHSDSIMCFILCYLLTDKILNIIDNLKGEK